MNSLELPKLNIPFQHLRYINVGGVNKVFDPLRGKYFILTPEEYVRQQFTSWLRYSLHYPTSLMANEVGIELNGTRKRCDTVIFNTDGSWLMIVEYKAPDVSITQEVFDQIVRYNIVLKAQFLVITNGINLYCCKIDYIRSSYLFLSTVPDYHEIQTMMK